MILFGHQTGNPNSHHAALAHFERGRLQAFVVPWFPGPVSLALLKGLPPTRAMAMRLSRRRFEPLAGARLVQGRLGEFRRLFQRVAGVGDEGLCYEVNDWLMRTMKRQVRNGGVTAVHSPEDASLWQFEEAKRLGKACIYDLPIGYYPWWKDKQSALAETYAEWIPAGGVPANRYVRPEQKVREMELADVVLVACSFVEETIREFLPAKRVALARYGVDAEFWSPPAEREHAGGDGRSLRFIYAGQSSIRKGIPVLVEAWEKAQLRDAELVLVGSWQLAKEKVAQLPRGIRLLGPVGPESLRQLYRESDVFVFPSFFEGFGLVILEALACGLPVVATERSAGPDVLDAHCGRLVMAGDVGQLVDTLRWFDANRDKLPEMKRASRRKALEFTWDEYRTAVALAVTPYI